MSTLPTRVHVLVTAAIAVRDGDSSRAEQVVTNARDCAGRGHMQPIRLDPDDIGGWRSPADRGESGMVLILLMRHLYDATAVVVSGRWLLEQSLPYPAVPFPDNLAALGIGVIGDPARGDVVAYRDRNWPGVEHLTAVIRPPGRSVADR